MRKSLLKIIICFMSVMLLAGCENDSDASDSAPEDKPENVSEPVKEEETTSLAQRMAGKYSYKYSDEELYIMDVIPFGDNLYAFCGQAMTEDSDSTEAYTFWASEFIPYDASEMESTDGDSVRVKELRFSVMSQAGKYWDRGQDGTITLTDDGLVYTRAHPYILGNRRMALFLGLYSRASAESLMQRTETAMLPIRAYPAA